MQTFAITAGKRYVLRPSLAAAISLHNRHNITKVLEGLADWRFGTLHDIVAECAPEITQEERQKLVKRLCWPAPHPQQIEMFQRLGLALIGIDNLDATENDNEDDNKTNEPADFDKLYRRLFEIGTGWLGWTPQETLAATPVEITAAYNGRVDCLKAIFGGSNNEPKTKHTAQTPKDMDRVALGALQRWGLEN